MNTLIIARAELRRIFLSPLAWAVLAVVQVLLGFVFVNVLFAFINQPGFGGGFGGRAPEPVWDHWSEHSMPVTHLVTSGLRAFSCASATTRVASAS